jgi:phosphoglucomutase
MKIKFGTSGWRAIIADEFTFENVARVTHAIAQYVKSTTVKFGKPKILVGYDTRFLSREFALKAASVLMEEGISAYVTKAPTPTPAQSFYIINAGFSGGINFTASHNPAQYNGLKFSIATGASAPGEVTSRIEELINKNMQEQKAFGGGSIVENIPEVDALPGYMAHIKKFVDFKAIRRARLKIAIDPMYGAGMGYLDALLEPRALKIASIRSFPNPSFGGKSPEPKDATLDDIKALVKKKKFDLGLALDGDADRFGIIDRGGVYVDANYILCIITDYLARKWKKMKYVARSVATTGLLDRIAAHHNLKILETPVGFKHLGNALLKGDCLIAGEESSGLSVVGHIPEKDGILACLLMAEIAAKHKMSIMEMREKLFKKFGKLLFGRFNLHLKSETQKQGFLEKLKNNPPSALAGKKVTHINRKDGFKFILEGGSWMLLRPSGTEPLIRMYAEAESEGMLSLLLEDAKKLV